MSALPPAVAAVRGAVRSALLGRQPGDLVLVACSGGADSLALAVAAGFVAPRMGLRAGLVTVDHGLQEGSAARAGAVSDWARGAGFEPVETCSVRVAGRPGGPEAAARHARYEALVGVARRWSAAVVLVGHTLDDQAETVLLAMARGAGPHGLAGMPVSREVDGVLLLRPLLAVSRSLTRAACVESGLRPWDDPHNGDPAYARSRVRGTALPALVGALGPAVVANLARTAALVAADNEVLDGLAARGLAEAGDGAGGLRVSALADLPAGVRGRALHAWAKRLGAPGGALSHRHVAALEALVVRWHGQGAVHLPGGVLVARSGAVLRPVPPAIGGRAGETGEIGGAGGGQPRRA